MVVSDGTVVVSVGIVVDVVVVVGPGASSSQLNGPAPTALAMIENDEQYEARYNFHTPSTRPASRYTFSSP